MKHKMRTKEWLADTRERSGLTLPQLADLSGAHSQTVHSIESGVSLGSTDVWSKLEKALYEYVPAAFVDEAALIDVARKYESLALQEGDRCRLYYATGYEGVAFTALRPDREGESTAPHVVLSWVHAIELLEAQKQAFDRKKPRPSWVNGKNAANLLCMSQAEVLQMIEDGRLVGVRKGRGIRVSTDSIEAYIAANQRS